jgi:G3E family GTPase
LLLKTIIVAGFLGSGKTTVLLETAKHLVAGGSKVAVIENEIGDVGIDGKYVAEQGLLVQELFGGCICCTLTVGLVAALRDMAESFSPDYVLVEPTGIAQPADLADAVREYSGCCEEVAVIVVLDAARYVMLSEVFGALLEGQILRADLVVVNKCDAASSEDVQRVVGDVRALNALVPLVTASEDDRASLASFLDALA